MTPNEYMYFKLENQRKNGAIQSQNIVTKTKQNTIFFYPIPYSLGFRYIDFICHEKPITN